MGRRARNNEDESLLTQCKECGMFYGSALKEEARKAREELEKEGYTFPRVPDCPVCRQRIVDIIERFGNFVRATHPHTPSRRHYHQPR